MHTFFFLLSLAIYLLVFKNNLLNNKAHVSSTVKNLFHKDILDNKRSLD